MVMFVRADPAVEYWTLVQQYKNILGVYGKWIG